MIPGMFAGNNERLLDVVFDTIQDGLLVLDRDFVVVRANTWLERRYSSSKPLAGKKCHAVLHGRQDRCPDCVYAKSRDTGTSQTQVMRSSSDVDPAAWFEVRVYLLEDAAGEVVGAVEHIKDITERKRTEELLKDEATRRRILVDQSRDGIVILDLNGKVFEANQQYARMLGYSMEEVRDLYVWDWDTFYDKETLLDMIAKVDNSGDQLETWHKRKDGTLCAVEISTNGVMYRGQKLVFCICRDITEKKALEARIHELAIRDPLTDVFNRRHVFERLAELIAEHSRTQNDFCVSILDLDHFKEVNDSHGHLAGDFVLKEFADSLGSLIRPYDLLGRYGGEEFIIVSRNAGAAETVGMVRRVMAAIREKAFVHDGRELRLTFSCGVAESSEFDPEALSIEGLVALADRRLYEAKAAGRDLCIGPVNLTVVR